MSKVKVKKVILYKMVSAHFEYFLSQSMLIGLGEDITPIDFGFTRLKVKGMRVICKKCKNNFCSLS